MPRVLSLSTAAGTPISCQRTGYGIHFRNAHASQPTVSHLDEIALENLSPKRYIKMLEEDCRQH